MSSEGARSRPFVVSGDEDRVMDRPLIGLAVVTKQSGYVISHGDVTCRPWEVAHIFMNES